MSTSSCGQAGHDPAEPPDKNNRIPRSAKPGSHKRGGGSRGFQPGATWHGGKRAPPGAGDKHLVFLRNAPYAPGSAPGYGGCNVPHYEMAKRDVRGALSKILVTPWVLGTVEKMRRAGTTEAADWARFWLETYGELGGRSNESGAKGCPRAGAYGLWFLGRLARGGRALQAWSIDRVNRELGKNATYAVIAADLLGTGMDTSLRQLWPAVQARYVQATGQEPAMTEQGEVKVALVLFCEGQLVKTQQRLA